MLMLMLAQLSILRSSITCQTRTVVFFVYFVPQWHSLHIVFVDPSSLQNPKYFHTSDFFFSPSEGGVNLFTLFMLAALQSSICC